MEIVTRSCPAIALRIDQPADEKVGGHEVDHRPLPSAAERFTQSLVSRLGGTVLGKVKPSQVQGHLLEAELRKWAALAHPASPNIQQWKDETLKKLGDLPLAPEAVRNTLSPFSGSADFFEQLLAMIGFIKGEYLEIYEALLTKYSDFYKAFNETIMAKMGDWITGKSDGKEVEISGELRAALEALRNKYQQAPDGVLYPVSGSATQEQAQKWAKALGLPDSCVQPDGQGGYRVMMDLSPLDAMIAAAPNGTVKWDTAKFQAWQTGFNSQEGDLKNQLQLFTTKYGSANSYHENFNKILSSQLSQYAEMLKAIASGIG
ncbi:MULTISPECIES: IpaD/SipD/SspD family type III secretion system needle tip protein [Pseudomonas]|uniref:IpaD/SipD/SspD family type III secretion system needle tip protein n=1 Tax=Pseudomonas asiatica TaxID=2219225 RepID=A0A9X4I251_9PSED|nr:IpaD/SipD/SspD family type III secretion system needle tip protein [Pseudomonas asiatica]MDD2114518.1 IpaD/SipD/SspD family type III secretion system needle tip protein [Pseudomonas asiatica]MEE1904280.1 IpaD/SipD/SspD family type III secretion system needle tip protein [Pseudomonas inefficax]MEE1909168.1 IpaD/SipD/SspD family type III secretion system needle tip protein [Pseudomonas inefficax]MEE1985595.1 IpaD/SipD/SspD family type III secretion system needle tip protein [Pseudomonas ineffi